MPILDLSIKPYLKGANYWTAPIDQLYHPTGAFGQDLQSLVYSRDVLQTTKFVPILLKEWFYLVEKDGYLVIDYIPNKFINFQKLEEAMWWLWKSKYDIIYHGPIRHAQLSKLDKKKIDAFIEKTPAQETIKPVMKHSTKGNFRFVCKKIASTKIANDNINRWTFGIITKGERDDWLEEIFAAIRKQKIPHYEIIVCGTYKDRNEKNFTYIPFKDRDDKGWLTKKKNLIVRAAKYENLCILHDRIVLDKNWFSGMKKYGNAFEFLCNKQILTGTTQRAGDWLTYGSKKLDNPYQISQLAYNDWDEYIYVSGQFYIMKKSIWEICPLNETRYWGEEDIEFSFRARDLGYLIRFNEYSSSIALSWRFGELPTKFYPSQILPRDKKLRRFLRVSVRVILLIPAVKKFLVPLLFEFTKTKIYQFLTSH